MSAVLECQGTLDGVEAVQTSAHADQLAKVAVLGKLIHGALVREHADGKVCVEVLVDQHVEHHPRALPVFAEFPYPDQGCADATLSAARKKAAQLPAGAEVMFLGRGIELGRHESRDVFRIIHVDGLDITTNV